LDKFKFKQASVYTRPRSQALLVESLPCFVTLPPFTRMCLNISCTDSFLINFSTTNVTHKSFSVQSWGSCVVYPGS